VLGLGDGAQVNAARLVVLGIALEYQGRRLRGRRVSDVALGTLITEAMRSHRTTFVTSLVARENIRSQIVCERNGLTSQTRFSPVYIRMTGKFDPERMA
jgi:hypothetical protein